MLKLIFHLIAKKNLHLNLLLQNRTTVFPVFSSGSPHISRISDIIEFPVWEFMWAQLIEEILHDLTALRDAFGVHRLRLCTSPFLMGACHSVLRWVK